MSTIHVETAAPSFVTEQACTQKLTSPPISRLPPEILQAIFIHCAHDYYATDEGSAIPSPPQWVQISHVCSHWRGMALACPALWSHLFVTSPRWTKELLTRSKQAPLKLKLKLIFPSDLHSALSSVEQVADHLERIQEFQLHLREGDFEDQLYPWLSSHAPRLQTLKIVIEWNEHTEQLPVLFDGETPALRELELTLCSVPWYSFRLTGLTTLALYSIPNQDQKTMAEFLPMLRSMQHLENLYILEVLHAGTPFLSKPYVNANLPHLSRFSICAPLSSINEFFACVNFPTKTELRLDWDCEVGYVVDDYALLFSVLGKRSGTFTDQGLFAPTFHSLLITREDIPPDSRVEDLIFSSLESDSDLDPEQDPIEWGYYNPLKIYIRLGLLVTMDGILTDISSFVSLSTIWNLHVICPPLPADFWRMALGHLQALRVIKLSAGSLPNLGPVLSLTNLAEDKGTGQDENAERIVLAPALEELHLWNMSFTWPRKRKQPVEETEFQSLCDALATRKLVAGRLTVSSAEHLGKRMIAEWKGGDFHVIKSRRNRGLRF